MVVGWLCQRQGWWVCTRPGLMGEMSRDEDPRDVGPGRMASSPAEESGSATQARERWWELVKDTEPVN